jgi:hypothetical protein
MIKNYSHIHPKQCPHNVTVISIIPTYDKPLNVVIIGSSTCKECRHNIRCSYDGDIVECNYPDEWSEEIFPAIL